jgi:hypothetical protein
MTHDQHLCRHCEREISDYARQEFPSVAANGYCCVKCQWGMTPRETWTAGMDWQARSDPAPVPETGL